MEREACRMSRAAKIQFVREHLASIPLLIGTAEEAAELSAAVLKLCRAQEGSNPTGKSGGEVLSAIREEMTDLRLCLDVLGERYVDADIYDSKLTRWVERLDKLNYPDSGEL